MRRLLFIFSFLSLLVVDGKAQEVETLTLEDCLRIGIDNNLSLEGKRKEIQKSKYGVSENRSKLLPQIPVIAGYNNNFDPPVSVTDGSSYGVPYNIRKHCSILPMRGWKCKCRFSTRHSIPLCP